jgi:hypothetical protein
LVGGLDGDYRRSDAGCQKEGSQGSRKQIKIRIRIKNRSSGDNRAWSYS